MAIDYVETDPGTGGSKIATYADQDDLQHELIIVEYLDSDGNPTQVSNENPLPARQQKVLTAGSNEFMVGVTAVEISEANVHRSNSTIHNHSEQDLFLGLGSAPTSTSFFTVLRDHEDYEFPPSMHYIGSIWALRPDGSDIDAVMITDFVGTE